MYQTVQSKLFITLALLLSVGFAAQAQAFSGKDAYISPEIAYADQLRQKVKLNSKADINHVSLNQLKILPGVDENIALKVIRNRPYADVTDFYRLPGLQKKEIEMLIRQLQPLVIFK